MCMGLLRRLTLSNVWKKLIGWCCDPSSAPFLLKDDYTEPTLPAITVDREDALVPFAGVRNDGSVFNATVVETSEGQFTMTFNTPHPLGAGGYMYQGSGEENAARDNPKVTLVEGSDTATGCRIMVTVDDNGAGADIFEDNDMSFIVYHVDERILQIYLDGVPVPNNS